MKERTFAETVDSAICQIRQMPIEQQYKVQMVAILSTLQTCYELDTNASNTLKALEPRCEFCGGKLSGVRGIRKSDGTVSRYRHCYSCHFDYEVAE